MRIGGVCTMMGVIIIQNLINLKIARAILCKKVKKKLSVFSTLMVTQTLFTKLLLTLFPTGGEGGGVFRGASTCGQ